MSEKKQSLKSEKLAYHKKTVYEKAGEKIVREAYDYAEKYMRFLNAAKTEREAVAQGIQIAEAAGVFRIERHRPPDGFFPRSRLRSGCRR